MPGETKALPGGSPLFQIPNLQTPNWLLLPSWLDEAWVEERAEPFSHGDLVDLLWGQYALFLYIRIQDDLLDRERSDLRLVFVADRFLLEALESFQRFPALDGEFWAFYRTCLRETVDGILEVRRLEEEPGRFTAEHLDLHAGVSAIFKLGTAAVCRLHGRTEEMPWLSNLLGRMAVFSQICDDLRDLPQDLEVGRFTWVANSLLSAKAGQVIRPGEWRGRMVAGFMRPERGRVLLAQLRRLARVAADGVPNSAPAPVHDLVRSLLSKPDAVEHGMHEARVRWVFGHGIAETDKPIRG